MTLSKGQLTKKKIINQAREVFNKKGIQLTIQELAMELGEGVSYITNHYRTKDHLFVAIANEYEEKYYQVLHKHAVKLETLQDVTQLASVFMDLQYEYRCAIIAVIASSNSQKVLFRHLKDSYNKNVSNFSAFVELLVNNGLVKDSLLLKEEMEVFRFQYVNLHTTWVVSMEIYDHPSGYKKMKFVYLRGIIGCFQAHLTTKGLRQFRSVNFR
jgi:AcrR family transcriptional regulator